MAESMFNKRGRPRFVAQIAAQDLVLPYLYTFYDVCSSFKYRDIVALSRALHIHPRTIEAWKYKEKKPSFQRILVVLDWMNQGKPMKLEDSSQEARSHSML